MAEGTTQTAPAGQTAADPKAATPAVDPKTGKPAAAAPAINPEATETIKVNGKEVKVTPAQLRSLAEQGYFAKQKVQNVDKLQKSTQALLDTLKSPEKFLSMLSASAKQLGVEPKTYLRQLVTQGLVDDDDLEFLAEQTSKKWLPRQKMTPEQIEDQKKLADYEKLKKQDEDRKKQQLDSHQKAQIQQVYQAVRSEVIKQIVADKTFPQVEGAISAVVNTLRAANKSGVQITSENVAKALEKVKKDFLIHQQAILDADKEAPDYGEKLISRIGEERALAISRAFVARLKAKSKTEPGKNGKTRESLNEVLGKKLNVLPSGHTVMEW